jgi:chromosome segregation ATPase
MAGEETFASYARESFEQIFEFHRQHRDHNERLTHQLAELARQQKHTIESLNHLENITMSNQDQLNALTDKVTNMQGDITALAASNQTLITTTTDLTAEVKKLQAANPDLDFTAINTAVDAADQAVKDAKTASDTANTNNPDPGLQGNGAVG